MLITFNKICLVLTYNAESPTARRRHLAACMIAGTHPVPTSGRGLCRRAGTPK